MKPTDKQISFANVIAKTLNIPPPEGTKQAHSQFISTFLPLFNKTKDPERKKLDAYLRTISVGYWEYF